MLAEAKRYAAQTGKTLTSVIEDALRETLSRQRLLENRPPVKLTTVPGNGLQPGVDLDDSAALLELMEASNDSA